MVSVSWNKSLSCQYTIVYIGSVHLTGIGRSALTNSQKGSNYIPQEVRSITHIKAIMIIKKAALCWAAFLEVVAIVIYSIMMRRVSTLLSV